MTRCTRPAWLEYRQKVSPYRSGVMPTPCKTWACDECGPGKRAEALRLIRHGARVGRIMRPRDPLRFLTFTYPASVDRRFDNPADVRLASEDFRELVKKWRHRGRTFEYVRVLERTKRGRIHIHVIMWGDYVAKCTDKGRQARGLPTGRGSGSPCYCKETRPCIQKLAHRAGFGWVDVRAVRSANVAAAYVAKYLGKQTSGDWPRYARRMACSGRFTDGVRLMDIHARWTAGVIRRLERHRHARIPEAAGRPPLETLPAGGVIWLGIAPAPPRAPPWPWGYDAATGERLPDPF